FSGRGHRSLTARVFCPVMTTPLMYFICKQLLSKIQAEWRASYHGHIILLEIFLSIQADAKYHTCSIFCVLKAGCTNRIDRSPQPTTGPPAAGFPVSPPPPELRRCPGAGGRGRPNAAPSLR